MNPFTKCMLATGAMVMTAGWVCLAGGAELTNPGDSRVLAVKDGKKAAFLISFDDAHPSQVPVVVPALRERGLVGTFYIFNRPQLIEQKDGWMAAAKSGVVTFGNHTFSHKYIQNSFPDEATCESEIVKCNDLIHELTPDQPRPRLIPYARPGGKTPADKGIGEGGMKPVLDKHHLFIRPDFWGASLHVKTIDDMKRLVDKTIEKGGMGHLDFHGVGKKSTINVTRDDFIAFLDYVKAHGDDLWVTDCVSWHCYEREQKDAAVKVVRSEGKEMAVQLTSGADKTFYYQPLTVETRVPGDWTDCRITQDGKTQNAAVRNGIVRYDAVPNAGEIIVRAVN